MKWKDTSEFIIKAKPGRVPPTAQCDFLSLIMGRNITFNSYQAGNEIGLQY